LRGGFGPGDEPALLTPQPVAKPERAPAAPPVLQPGVWHDGLAIAVERRSGVSPEL
jgi:hypothetical protein